MDDEGFRRVHGHRQLTPTNRAGVYASAALPADPMLRGRFLELGVSPEDRIIPHLSHSKGPSTKVRRRRAAQGAMEARLAFTDNLWAGCPIGGGSWSSITGTWKVPAAGKGIDDPPGKDGFYWMYAWVGLDGYGENELLQIGISHRVGADGQPEYWGWYEWVPKGPQTIDNWSVKRGDIVCAMVEYLKDSAGHNNAGSVSLLNLTSGQHFSLTLSPPSGVTMPGASAEWIVEDPGSGYPDYSLALFTPMTFSNCSCLSADGLKRGIPGDGDLENIVNSKGTQMTVVQSNPGADTFSVAYYKYNID
jgi:hypothetical protein